MQSEIIWKLWKKSNLNIEKNLKIRKKILKRYGKYGRKYWKDMKNTKKPKLNSEKIWKIQKKSKLNSEKIGTIWRKIVK